MPSNCGPFSFGSAVLPDGCYIVEGGERNLGQEAETTLGAIYDPIANTWTAIKPPSGWSTIGDGATVVLSNGIYMQTSCCDNPPHAAFLDPVGLTWSATGTGNFDPYTEEGFTLLAVSREPFAEAAVWQHAAADGRAAAAD
jgi:hypothetical protein